MAKAVTHFDLLIIGSGPSGHNAAIESAKQGKRVAIVDRSRDLGGVCLHTGTIPSKTLREAVLYLSGFRLRSFYGRGYRVKERIQVDDLMFRVTEVIKRQYAVLNDQLARAGVLLIDGHAKFSQEDRHTLAIEDSQGLTSLYTADFILIACGTRPARGSGVPFESPQVYDSDEFVQVTEGELPKSIIVVGGAG